MLFAGLKMLKLKAKAFLIAGGVVALIAACAYILISAKAMGELKQANKQLVEDLNTQQQENETLRRDREFTDKLLTMSQQQLETLLQEKKARIDTYDELVETNPEVETWANQRVPADISKLLRGNTAN